MSLVLITKLSCSENSYIPEVQLVTAGTDDSAVHVQYVVTNARWKWHVCVCTTRLLCLLFIYSDVMGLVVCAGILIWCV
jgi:hypothetical protein